MATLADGRTTSRPFCELATECKADAGLTFAQLAARTAVLDDEGRGLSASYLRQIFRGLQPPVPRALWLVAAALDIDPAMFLEYRLHLARRLFDESAVAADAADLLARIDEGARSGNAVCMQIVSATLSAERVRDGRLRKPGSNRRQGT